MTFVALVTGNLALILSTTARLMAACGCSLRTPNPVLWHRRRHRHHARRAVPAPSARCCASAFCPGLAGRSGGSGAAQRAGDGAGCRRCVAAQLPPTQVAAARRTLSVKRGATASAGRPRPPCGSGRRSNPAARACCQCSSIVGVSGTSSTSVPCCLRVQSPRPCRPASQTKARGDGSVPRQFGRRHRRRAQRSRRSSLRWNSRLGASGQAG